MKIRHIILLLLNQLEGKIESKTKLQKLLYFLSLKFNRDFEYSAHYYGPYSQAVDLSVDELVGAGFVDVERNTFGIDFKRGFEVKKYTFKLTEDGKNFALNLSKNNPPELKTIENFVRKLIEIGEPNYLSLSIAAKSNYILSQVKKPMDIKEIELKAREFNWEIEKDDIAKAISILEKLEFVE